VKLKPDYFLLFSDIALYQYNRA